VESGLTDFSPSLAGFASASIAICAMTDTTEQVVEQPAPDAIAPAPVTDQAQAESSPAVNDADESSEPRPKGVQKRIDELTRNWREAERREAALLDMLQRQQTPAKQEAVPEMPKAVPKLEDFNYDEASYQTALFKHVKDEAAQAARDELQQERTREKEQAKKQTFKQRETDFAKANPDYISLTRDPSLPFTRAIVELTAESEKGPEVLYYLAKNREIADRIAELSPVAAAREIGRIEAKLEKPPAPTPPLPRPAPVSQAPPPPPRLETSEPAIEKDPDQMSMGDWLKWRNKQLSRKKA
jgi:flagellar biosynthesis GTPase FlhF